MSKQNPPARVVVVGDALIDVLRDTHDSREFAGGAALNVAVGLSVLGVPTTLIAMVGDDADGEVLRAFLNQHGVQLIATPGPQGSSRAISDRTDGEPRYSFNDAAKARRVEFGAAERVALNDAALIVVSCFPFDDTAQTEALASCITDPERRLIIDPNPRAGMLQDGPRFVRNFEALAARSLLVKVGDDDADLLYESTLEELRDRLRDAGAQTVLATAGRLGASITYASNEQISVPIAHLAGPIIDTMGAGDATLASAVCTIVNSGVPQRSASWQELLGDAMRVAAATCRHEGALLQRP